MTTEKICQNRKIKVIKEKVKITDNKKTDNKKQITY